METQSANSSFSEVPSTKHLEAIKGLPDGYEFGEFRLDATRRFLATRDGKGGDLAIQVD
jgi:hypothetical protein